MVVESKNPQNWELMANERQELRLGREQEIVALCYNRTTMKGLGSV